MKEVYINEDRLLEGDQSNISIYRIVFYAEVFIMVKNGSMTFFYYSSCSLSLLYYEGLYAEMYPINLSAVSTQHVTMLLSLIV